MDNYSRVQEDEGWKIMSKGIKSEFKREIKGPDERERIYFLVSPLPVCGILSTEEQKQEHLFVLNGEGISKVLFLVFPSGPSLAADVAHNLPRSPDPRQLPWIIEKLPNAPDHRTKLKQKEKTTIKTPYNTL